MVRYIYLRKLYCQKTCFLKHTKNYQHLMNIFFDNGQNVPQNNKFQKVSTKINIFDWVEHAQLKKYFTIELFTLLGGNNISEEIWWCFVLSQMVK